MGAPITVYFACPHCNLVYQAKQVRFFERISGTFDCSECSKPVHSWSGPYNYLYWKPVTDRS
jgi:hypothetical protein